MHIWNGVKLDFSLSCNKLFKLAALNFHGNTEHSENSQKLESISSKPSLTQIVGNVQLISYHYRLIAVKGKEEQHVPAR